jgi:WD40 repeat protein
MFELPRHTDHSSEISKVIFVIYYRLPANWSIIFSNMSVTLPGPARILCLWWILLANLVLAQTAGTLELNIVGLPPSTDARVTLNSALLSKPISITRSGQFTQLRPGTYTLEADRLTVNDTVYTPQYLRRTIEINPGATTAITLTYSPPAGSLLLTIAGLPTATPARISLSGDFLDAPLSINRSGRVADLLPGTYTLSISTVRVDGLTYSPSVARQTLIIRSREETTATITYNPPPGSLRVNIRGIPPEQARLTLSGTNFSRAITSSITLENLEVGTYTLTAQPVLIGNLTLTAQPVQQTVNIAAGQTGQADVVYQAPPGSLRINIGGIFGDTLARITLSGNGVNLAIERSGLIRDLLPGIYTLTAEPLEVAGVIYQVAPQRQQVEIVTQTETLLNVAYSPPSGSLRLQVEGLPSGTNGKLVLRGANNYAREFNLGGSVTLGNLPPGEYTLSATEAFSDGDPYDPKPDNQVLQVLPARTLVAKVAYSMSQGRLVLVPQGTPVGLPAQVTLTGTPQPTPFSLTTEERLELPKGNYSLTSPLLYYQGKAFGPLKDAQTVQIIPRKETRVPIAYQELPPVDMTIEPDIPMNILLTGPNNSRIELTLTAPETLLDMLPGIYRIESNSASVQTFSLMPGQPNTFKITGSVTTASLKNSLTGHIDYVYSVAFSPDGKTLASGSSDRTVKLWEVATGRNIGTIQAHAGTTFSVAFSPDGKIIASGGGDNTAKLMDAATGRTLATLQGHSGSVNRIAFSPDGKMLASGSSDRTIKLWEVASTRTTVTLTGHTGTVYGLAFSPDGRLLASGSDDNTIRIWEVFTGRHLATLTGHTGTVYSLAFAPDGNFVASGSGDRTIRIWNPSSGQSMATLAGHGDLVTSIAFVHTGVLVSGSYDNTIKIWNLSSRQAIATLTEHSRDVNTVAISPDGKTLVSGSDDQTIRLWQLK